MEEVELTHEELMKITTTAINELLKEDSFLSDLPKAVTLEEVNNQIALQYGKSITIYVLRGDGEKMPVVVPQAEGTVAHLKKAIKRYMTLKLKRQAKKKQRRPKLLSWRYIWKTYHLQFGDVVLSDNNAKLSDLGLRNKSSVEFVKRWTKKG
ncbi:UNVERIFIED_CONTAM: hypothetical protein PYX00_004560 [Menopon gallinae]|uniref:SNRNP25 ubiquitin-like domain-containing protein n=1 Tax=Menopon gallinae TaxID=328185 RepID=A0AAW2I5U1_9NEOP